MKIKISNLAKKENSPTSPTWRPCLQVGLIFIFLLFSFFFGAKNIFAATTVNFAPENGTYMLGDDIPVKILINSDVSVNAVSIKIKYPTDVLSLSSISKTKSIISLWAQEANFSNTNGTASLEGVVLSGFTGKNGLVATLLFKSKTLGRANLKFETASVFSNDGNGTDIASGKNSSTLTIIKKDIIASTHTNDPVETPEAPSITLKTPVLTYYKQETNPDEFTILKGTADPLVDVEFIITSKNTGGVMVNHAATNSDGQFTYVPESKLLLGTYSITARSNNGQGISSAYMSPVEISVKQHYFIMLIQKITSYITILTPLFAIIILLILLILYGIYRIKKFKILLKNKLSQAEKELQKDWKTLEEDVMKENLILQKIAQNEPLKDTEKTFMDKFKQDIETTVEETAKNLKEL